MNLRTQGCFFGLLHECLDVRDSIRKTGGETVNDATGTTAGEFDHCLKMGMVQKFFHVMIH
jgi:hypothetical protein